MCRSAVNRLAGARSAFTLTEAVVTSFIALYVIVGAWSIYYMTWRWWRETAPVIEAERTARIALASVIDGMVDSTAGSDGAYSRRSGIAWAVYEPGISAGLSTADKIEFGLEKEKADFGGYPTPHNIRAFYLGTPETGLRAVYYKDNVPTSKQIKATRGITDLKFEKFKDASNKVYVKVTATVDKDVVGTRSTPYHIKVEYVDYVFLRNF